MFEPILSGIFLIGGAVAALLGFIFGMHKKWQVTVVKIANTLLAMALAVFFARIISLDGAGYALNFLVDRLPGQYSEDIKAMLTTPAVADAIKASVSMFLAPILFSVAFIIIKPILALFRNPIARFWVSITEKKDRRSEKRKNKADRWRRQHVLEHKRFRFSSGLLGALSGFILFYVIAIPGICGLSLTGKVAKPIVQSIDNPYSAMAADFCEAATTNQGVVAMRLLGGETVYQKLTTYDVAGHKASAENELTFMASSIDVLTKFIKPSENYNGAEAKQALENMATAFDNSTLIPSILPGMISVVDQRWDNGQAFCGIYRISFGDSLSPVVDTVFDIFCDTTFDNMKTDFSSGLKIIGVFAENGPILSQLRDPLSLLADKETTAKVFEAFYENERFYAIVPAFAECGIEIMTDALKLPENAEEHYAKMGEELITATDAVANELLASSAGGTISPSYYNLYAIDFAVTLDKIFDNYGIDVKADSCIQLAYNLLESRCTGQLNAESVITILSETEIEIIEADGTNTSVVKLSPGTYAEKTQVIFTDSIMINHGKPADVHNEALQLADAFATASELAQKIGTEGLDTKAIVIDLGHLLDCFNRTHTFGTDLSRSMLICMLQSEQVRNTLDIGLINVTRLANDICDSAGEDSYTTLLTNLVNTLEIIERVSNNEDVGDQVAELIQNLTPSSIEAIKHITTPEAIEKLGIPAESAGHTSDLLSSMFDSLGDANGENQLTEEEYKAEAKAVTDILNIAINATNSDSSGSVFGEESATNVTVSEFIDRVSDSKIVSQTIVDTVYDENGDVTVDPLDTSINLNDTEKAELVDAMNAQLAGTTDEAEKLEKQKTLIAAAALVNVDVEINSDGTFVLPENLPF